MDRAEKSDIAITGTGEKPIAAKDENRTKAVCKEVSADVRRNSGDVRTLVEDSEPTSGVDDETSPVIDEGKDAGSDAVKDTSGVLAGTGDKQVTKECEGDEISKHVEDKDVKSENGTKKKEDVKEVCAKVKSVEASLEKTEKAENKSVVCTFNSSTGEVDIVTKEIEKLGIKGFDEKDITGASTPKMKLGRLSKGAAEPSPSLSDIACVVGPGLKGVKQIETDEEPKELENVEEDRLNTTDELLSMSAGLGKLDLSPESSLTEDGVGDVELDLKDRVVEGSENCKPHDLEGEEQMKSESEDKENVPTHVDGKHERVEPKMTPERLKNNILKLHSNRRASPKMGLRVSSPLAQKNISLSAALQSNEDLNKSFVANNNSFSEMEKRENLSNISGRSSHSASFVSSSGSVEDYEKSMIGVIEDVDESLLHRTSISQFLNSRYNKSRTFDNSGLDYTDSYRQSRLDYTDSFQASPMQDSAAGQKNSHHHSKNTPEILSNNYSTTKPNTSTDDLSHNNNSPGVRTHPGSDPDIYEPDLPETPPCEPRFYSADGSGYSETESPSLRSFEQHEKGELLNTCVL